MQSMTMSSRQGATGSGKPTSICGRDRRFSSELRWEKENPNNINVTRELAERCKYPEGGDWETLASQAKKDKDRRRHRTREAATKSETQGEDFAQLRKAEAAVRKTRSGEEPHRLSRLTELLKARAHG